MKLNVTRIAKRLVFVASLFMAVLFYQTLAIADETSSEKTKIPATSTEILAAIDQHENELNKTIQADKLDEVHHHAFAIRDLVDALPEHSSQLSSDKLEQVKTNMKYIDVLAKRLDTSGDAKDKAATQANFTKLQKLLESIRSSYSMPESGSKTSSIQNTK
jgi:hypothetical protein